MVERATRDIPLDVVTVPTWRELRRRLPQLLVGIPVLGVGIALTPVSYTHLTLPTIYSV